MEVNDQVIDQTEEEVPLEETIRAAIRGDETPVVNDTPAPVESKPSVARDETGKFAQVQKDKPRETLTLPAKVEAAVPVVDNAVQPTFKAPDGWKGELKALFPTLPPEIQAEISRREADTHKALTKQDEERTLGKRVNEMATPYLPTIKAEGATVEKAFQDYLQTAHVLRSGNPVQKAQSILAVMNQFKVNPQDLFSILQSGNVNLGGAVQPAQYNPVIETLTQRLGRLEQERQQEIQQRQLQEEHSLQGQIDDFSSKPGHEHFEKVRTHMGVLLENGLANDLEDAYQKAVYAEPDIRSSLIASQSQAEQDKRLTEAKAKAEAARRAGGSVIGGPGSARPLNGSGADIPIEETIRSAIREASGRIN